MSVEEIPMINELVLYTLNNSQIYKDRVIPVLKNLARRVVKGEYDSDKALKIWERIAADAAKGYAEEFGSNGYQWYTVFSVPVRREAAKELMEHYESELIYYSEKLIGPEEFWVTICDFSRDVNGNRIAHHDVYTMDLDRRWPGTIRYKTNRRQQVGSASNRDAYVTTAVEKAGFIYEWYELEKVFDQGDAPYDTKNFIFRRLPVKL